MQQEKNILYSGQYLRLCEKAGWEWAERAQSTGVVMIVALNAQNEVILVEQPRIPVGKPVIEFAAGLVGDSAAWKEESLEASARREFLEETGYEAQEMVLLGSGPSSPGLSSEIIHIFQAKHLARIHAGGGDESEHITLHEIPLGEIKPWLRQKAKAGFLIDPKVFAGLYLLQI